MAAEENDVVYLFASTAARGSASGDVMEQIWNDYIIPSLPSNVIPDVGGGSPIAKVYELLSNIEKEGSDDVIRIYSDEGDIKKYTSKSLSKFAPTLYAAGRVPNERGELEDDPHAEKRIELRGVPRTATVNVSGTKMREYLESGDVEKFVQNLPPAIQGDGEEIFKRLGGKQKVQGEALLRKYIRGVFSIR
jgi:hypothetical protein